MVNRRFGDATRRSLFYLDHLFLSFVLPKATRTTHQRAFASPHCLAHRFAHCLLSYLSSSIIWRGSTTSPEATVLTREDTTTSSFYYICNHYFSTGSDLRRTISIPKAFGYLHLQDSSRGSVTNHRSAAQYHCHSIQNTVHARPGSWLEPIVRPLQRPAFNRVPECLMPSSLASSGTATVQTLVVCECCYRLQLLKVVHWN